MLAFDTETTGLLKPDAVEQHLQPFIIEIYICKFNWDGKITNEFKTFVKPPVPIPEKITEITGITNQDVKGAPSFIQIYDELADFCLGENEIYAHNCSFDIGMMFQELRRHDLQLKFPWPKHHRCTVEISYPIRNRRLKLGQLYELATGKQFFNNAHRADADVKAMIKCICWLKKEGFIR